MKQDSWHLSPAQFGAQSAFAKAVGALGGEPACRAEPQFWDDVLDEEKGHGSFSPVKRQKLQADRLARVEYAQRKCLECPLMMKECRALLESDDSLRGVISGEYVTDHEIEMEELAS